MPLIANENSFLMSWIGSAANLRRCVIISVGVCIDLPLSLLRRLDMLKYTSVISLCGVLYLVFILALDAGRGDEAVSQFKPVWPGVAISVPLMTFALNCHIQAPIVYAELKPKLRNAPKMGIACGIAMVICLLIYLPAGIFGYLRFGESVLGDVLTVGQEENNHCSASSVGSGGFLVSDYWADGARVCLAVTAMSGYALNHFPARPALFSIYKRVARLSGRSAVTADSPPFIFVMIEGVTWLVVCVTISLFCSDLAAIFSLTGSTCGSTVIFILPGFFWWNYGPMESFWKRLLPCCLLWVVGGVILIVGTMVTVLGLK